MHIERHSAWSAGICQGGAPCFGPTRSAKAGRSAHSTGPGRTDLSLHAHHTHLPAPGSTTTRRESPGPRPMRSSRPSAMSSPGSSARSCSSAGVSSSPGSLPGPAISATATRPDPRARSFTPAVERLLWRVRERTGVRFNHVLVNRYRDGSDSMGFHADDEPELGEDPVVATLSLGAPRRLVLKPWRRHGGERHTLRPRPRESPRDGRHLPAGLLPRRSAVARPPRRQYAEPHPRRRLACDRGDRAG